MQQFNISFSAILLICGCDAVQKSDIERSRLNHPTSTQVLSHDADLANSGIDGSAAGNVNGPGWSSTSQLTQSNSIPTKYPIVLHHGYMAGENLGSFKKIQSELQSRGYQVFITLVPPSSTIEARGDQLAAQLQKIVKDTGVSKLNIVAHSQGGLDARYAISSRNLATIVASLSTLSTPHLGTSLADYILENSSPLQQRLLARLIDGFARVISSAGPNDSIGAAKTLSVDYVSNTFNPKNQDQPNILYQSWASEPKSGMKASLSLSAALITSKEGANDGIVSTKSASRGEFRGVLDADHLDLIGVRILDIGGGFDHNKFYVELASDLAAKGL